MSRLDDYLYVRRRDKEIRDGLFDEAKAELDDLRFENERLKAERTWRPISAVPTDHQWKILASKYGCFPGIYYDGWIGSDGEEIQHNITHWMPLPEPPKEEK